MLQRRLHHIADLLFMRAHLSQHAWTTLGPQVAEKKAACARRMSHSEPGLEHSFLECTSEIKMLFCPPPNVPNHTTNTADDTSNFFGKFGKRCSGAGFWHPWSRDRGGRADGFINDFAVHGPF